jgi:hypothetical protein
MTGGTLWGTGKQESDERRPADETNVTGRHANATGRPGGHAGGGRVRRQNNEQLDLHVDEWCDQHDEHGSAQAFDKTGLLDILIPTAGL